MKIRKFTKALFIFTCFVGVTLSNTHCQVRGQAPIFPADGFVVLKNGDTISGSIVWRLKYIENNPCSIKFTNSTGETEIFDAGMIHGFGSYTSPDYDNPVEFYESVPSYKKSQYVFLNRFLDGKMKVFMNRSSISSSTTTVEEKSKFDGFGFSFSPEEGLSIGPNYKTSYNVIQGRTKYSSYFVSKGKEKLLRITKKNYEEVFPVIFGDCAAIQKEIEKNPELKEFKNFLLLAEVYDQECH